MCLKVQFALIGNIEGKKVAGIHSRPTPLLYIFFSCNILKSKEQKMSQSFSNNYNSLNTTYINPTVADNRPNILAWLSPLDPKSRHQDIRDRRVETVGEWVLRTEEFRSWYTGSGSSVVHEPSGLEPNSSRAGSSPSSPGVPRARAGSSPVWTRLERTRVSWQAAPWRLEQGSTSGLESLGGSSRLGQGSTSRLDSRLEPLAAFLADSWRLEPRGATSRAGSSLGLDSARAGS